MIEQLFDDLLAASEDTNKCERIDAIIQLGNGGTRWVTTVKDELDTEFPLNLIIDPVAAQAWLSNGRNRVGSIATLSYTIPQESRTREG